MPPSHHETFSGTCFPQDNAPKNNIKTTAAVAAVRLSLLAESQKCLAYLMDKNPNPKKTPIMKNMPAQRWLSPGFSCLKKLMRSRLTPRT